MPITDWEKWMIKHHIKLEGEENDSGADAKPDQRSVHRPEVETPSKRDGRQQSDRYIPKHARKRTPQLQAIFQEA